MIAVGPHGPSNTAEVRDYWNRDQQTTMLQLNRNQRTVLADKLPDVANIAAGALVFAQFVGESPFSPWLAVCGIGLWAFLVVCAVALVGRTDS